mgnify:CR=1 FL=1
MNVPVLQDSEFALFQKMIYDIAGISMSEAKKALVGGRLAKRVKHYDLPSYRDYFEMLKAKGSTELQVAVDLLTTNETFFFREPKHFDFLRNEILPDWLYGTHRVWSAACSSGEEAYTLAMVMAAHCPTDAWEVVATDISTRVLERARSGHYAIERARHIPKAYLNEYCLKGTGRQEGTFIMTQGMRRRVDFRHANLTADLSQLGHFDVIFLRNVLIYFDLETKRRVVMRLLRQLKPGGHLLVGHSESLNGVVDGLKVVVPSVYCRT